MRQLMSQRLPNHKLTLKKKNGFCDRILLHSPVQQIQFKYSFKHHPSAIRAISPQNQHIFQQSRFYVSLAVLSSISTLKIISKKFKLIAKMHTEHESIRSEAQLHFTSMVRPPSFIKCLWKVLISTLPNAAYSFFQCILIIINVHFVSSDENEKMVAGLGLGIVWLTATTCGPILALNTGTTVLASQAFGALNYELVPVYFYRAIVLRVLQSIPCYIFCACSVWIFKLLDFDETVAEAASACCVYSFIAIIGIIIYDTLKAFVNAHALFFPIMIIQLIVVVAHWFYCKFFAETLNLGITGVTIAFGISQLTGGVILIGYVLLSKNFKKTLKWPHKNILRGIWTQFINEIYISSFIMLQWIAYMLCVLMGGGFTLKEVVSQTFIYNIALLLFAPILALSETSMILIGKALGRKEALKAINISKALITMTVIFLLIEILLLLLFTHDMVRFLIKDEGIIEDTTSTLMAYIWLMPADFIQITFTSILKSAARERIGALMFFLSFFAIGVTVAFVLGLLLRWAAHGIWIGMGIGIYTMAFLAGMLLWKTDFECQIRKIDDRLVSDESGALELSTNRIEDSERFSSSRWRKHSDM